MSSAVLAYVRTHVVPQWNPRLDGTTVALSKQFERYQYRRPRDIFTVGAFALYYAKMAGKFKSPEDITQFADALKRCRKLLGLTLKDVERSVSINSGQLSRFEQGDFKTDSKNLQLYAKFLQINDTKVRQKADSLGERLEQFAARSPQHREAAEKLLSALEHLG